MRVVAGVLAVVLVWVAPWRAARTIRSQEQAIDWLLDTIVGNVMATRPPATGAPPTLYLVK